MDPIKNTLVDAFEKWLDKQLDQDLKDKSFTILGPYIEKLLLEKTLTEEEKQQVKKESDKITEIIDKHFSTISTRSLEN